MNRLHDLIRRLPTGVEFLVVVSWAFGMPIFSSILQVGAAGAGGAPRFTNEALIGLVVFEIVQSIFLFWFLHVRGWTLQKVGLELTWRSTSIGLVLLALSFLIFYVAQLMAQFLPIDVQAATAMYPRADAKLSMQLVFIASTVNGIFEELFVAGYVITVLSQVRGVWTAVNVSTGLRLLYHLYQGPIGIITVVPIGLMYAYVYARTRQLWPLILAHVLVDIIGLTLSAST